MNFGVKSKKSTLFMIASLFLLWQPAEADTPKQEQANGTTSKAAIKETKCSAPKLSTAVFETTIKAPKEIVWTALTDFNHYPKIFPRMKSCQILRKEGSLVYLETILKPQMFVKQECQHTVNDLGGKPDILHWRMLDGNFKSVEGEWRLKPSKDGQSCLVSYTLEVDPGPIIPKSMAIMALKMVQKEIVVNIKQVIENTYAPQEQLTKISTGPSSTTGSMAAGSLSKTGNNFLSIKAEN